MRSTHRLWSLGIPWGTKASLILSLTLSASIASAGVLTLTLGNEAEGLVPRELLVGEWQAIVQEGNYPQPVMLRIDRVEPGETAGKMTYSSPRRCNIDLEYGGPHEGRQIFYMIRFTNCYKYENTDFVAISVVPSEDKTVEPAAEEQAPVAEEPKELGQFTLGKKNDAPAKAPAPAPASEGEEEDMKAKPLEHILYSITLGGVERETAIMDRQ